MACAARQIGEHTADIGSGPHRVLVIADRGDRAFVVAVRFEAPPAVGDRFQFQGLTWEIVRPRSPQRGVVACPLRRA